MRLSVWIAIWLIAAKCYADPNDLTKTWYLTSINSMPIELLDFPERKPYLTLRDDNRYLAYAGCNQISGSYALEDNRLTFSPAAVTRMTCQNNMDFEQTFLQMLSKVEFWSMIGDGQTLNLKSKNLEILAVFNDLDIDLQI